MSSPSAFEIKGKRLFEDESFLVIKTSFFDHSLLVYLFGTIYVQRKDTTQIIKTTPEERKVMIAVVGELAQLGVHPPDERLNEFMHEFCSAVAGRGSVSWQYLIRHCSPKETAKGYA